MRGLDAAEIVKIVGLARENKTVGLRGAGQDRNRLVADLVKNYGPSRFEFFRRKISLVIGANLPPRGRSGRGGNKKECKHTAAWQGHERSWQYRIFKSCWLTTSPRCSQPRPPHRSQPLHANSRRPRPVFH